MKKISLEKYILSFKENRYSLWIMRFLSIIALILVAVPTVMIYGARPKELPHHIKIIMSVW